MSNLSSRQGRLRLVLLVTMILGSSVAAQDAEIESLVGGHECLALLVHDGLAIGGLESGGLALWSLNDPTALTQIPAGRELSGNRVVDLAWSGANVWVATDGGGLTRITDIATDPQMRQFTSVLGGMNLTAVTGAIVGDIERVYYGIADGGVGEIVNGVGGSVYTVAQDGLVDDNANALIIFEGDLFVGTEVGVSRFSDNTFTTVNDGLVNPWIYDFAVTDDGVLLAAGRRGVLQWDPDTKSWSRLGLFGAWTYEVVAGNGEIWARGANSLLGRWNGTDYDFVTMPHAGVLSLDMTDELWVGGRWRADLMTSTSSQAYLGRYDGDDSFSTWIMNTTLVWDPEGVTIGQDGRIWFGGWAGQAVSAFDPDETEVGSAWENLYEVASDDNGQSGLITHGANVLSMTSGSDGAIWVGQYNAGILRHDPATGRTEPITHHNSPLPDSVEEGQGARVLNMVVHPDGTLILLHDQDEGLVDIVTDPENWSDSDNWSHLPEGTPGLGNGQTVWDAVVQHRDVIWFAVKDVGLVRWDINGLAAGPDDPLTWHDQSDDIWWEPIADLDDTPHDPTGAKGLALAPDGSIWVGGIGLFRFDFDPAFARSTVHETWNEKTDGLIDGLINQAVTDVVVDVNGDCWVCTTTGINRIRHRGTTVTVDAWMDLANYYANSLYQLLYSPNVISALPGREYRRLAVSADGRRVVISGDQGAAWVSLGTTATSGGTDIAKAFCYPNPVTPGPGDARLKLGGIAASLETGLPARVQIYNLEGELVFEDKQVTAGEGFWDGTNRYGQLVVSGMYMVKVLWNQQYHVFTLAVVH